MRKIFFLFLLTLLAFSATSNAETTAEMVVLENPTMLLARCEGRTEKERQRCVIDAFSGKRFGERDLLFLRGVWAPHRGTWSGYWAMEWLGLELRKMKNK